MAKVIEFKEGIVVYEEDPAGIRSIQIPSFCEELKRVGQRFSAFTVQWPQTFGTDARRDAIERLAQLLESHGRTHVMWREAGQVHDEDGFTAFSSRVGTNPWWLGDVFALTEDTTGRVIIAMMPGSDGAFLHILFTVEQDVAVQAALNAAFS